MRFWWIILPVLTLLSCGEDDSNEALGGIWEVEKYGQGYDTWRIANDTVYVNEGSLFESRGFIQHQGDTMLVTIGRGVYRFPVALDANSITLQPEPGLDDPITITRSERADHPYLHASTVPVNLVHATETEAIPYDGNAAHIFFGPKDGRSSMTEQEYSMQMGPDYHLARLADMEGFYNFKSASSTADPNALTAVVYIDGGMPMDQVYDLTYELRTYKWFKVAYVAASTNLKRQVQAVRRNLFMLGRAETAKALGDTTSFSLDPHTMRSDFYARVAADSVRIDVVIQADGNLLVNGAPLAVQGFDGYVKNQLFEANAEGKTPYTYILTAVPEANFSHYLTVLDHLLRANNQLRDDYCRSSVGGTYADMLAQHPDADELNRLVLTRYPGKIVEVSPAVYQLYFRHTVNNLVP